MSYTWRWKTSTIAARRPKAHFTFGMVERLHKTVLDECYRVAFRQRLYRTIDELQADLDTWIKRYHEERPHQGRWCKGQDANANLHRQPATGTRETDSSLAISDIAVKLKPLHRLSDKVLLTTPPSRV
jgi:hypothetical protein